MPKHNCETSGGARRPRPIPEETALYRVLEAVANAVADELIGEQGKESGLGSKETGAQVLESNGNSEVKGNG